MPRRALSLITLFLVALIAGGYWWRSSRTASLSEEEWDICEAVLRYEFSAFQDPHARAIVVSVQGLSPSNRFLRRFAGHKPPVGGELSEQKGVHDLLFFIGVIDRSGEDKAAVFARHQIMGDPSVVEPIGGEGICHVIRRDGRWLVDRFDLQIVY